METFFLLPTHRQKPQDYHDPQADDGCTISTFNAERLDNAPDQALNRTKGYRQGDAAIKVKPSNGNHSRLAHIRLCTTGGEIRNAAAATSFAPNFQTE
jgi:hypothetical protein